MAIATAFYGFLGILLSFEARQEIFAGALGVSGKLGHLVREFPAGLYVLQSFVVSRAFRFRAALFFWYWDRTRADRTWTQWLVLGLISGLMMDVYYVCAVLLVVPLVESLAGYWQGYPLAADASRVAPLSAESSVSR